MLDELRGLELWELRRRVFNAAFDPGPRSLAYTEAHAELIRRLNASRPDQLGRPDRNDETSRP